MSVPLRDRTVAIQRSIETGVRHPLHYFDSRTYVQHNLALGDGLAPLLEFLDSIPAGAARVTPHRAFQDGDVSFAHLDYVLPGYGHVVGFEVHRWREDRIVEHWDNLQAYPEQPNRSGRSVVDGATQVTDHELTADNKRRVSEFADAVLIGRDHDRLSQFVAGDVVQHDPSHGDGLAEFARLLTSDADPLEFRRVHHVFGEGNFMLLISEGQSRRQHAALYNLVRIQGGLVAEHWDVIEAIPARESWQNTNGKF
jgi:predicted SnoaL-like aldol condensation-catalyzing enzyme